MPVAGCHNVISVYDILNRNNFDLKNQFWLHIAMSNRKLTMITWLRDSASTVLTATAWI